jgi:L-malate glycosyltransferase
MNVLVLGMLSGGIGEHVARLRENSNNRLIVLSYGRVKGDFHVPVVDLPVLRAFLFLFLGFFYGVYLIRKEEISVIHSHYVFPAGLLGSVLSFASGVPQVHTVHGSDAYRLPVSLHKLIRGKIICVSRSLQARLASAGVSSTLIYNGINPAAGKKIPLAHPAVLFVGSLTRNKAGMLNAIIEKAEGINFYVAGTGPVEVKGARLLGQLSREELSSFYSSADILVNCSDWEGFSLAVLEAFSFGLPVVARPNSALKELLGRDRGLYADTPAEFVSQINKLLKDKELKSSIVKKALVFSRGFSWKKTAKELDVFYDGLV